MTPEEQKAQIDRDKVRCQEVLDRISMFNPHSLILAAMDAQGSIVMSRIQHDPGIECLLDRAINLGTMENISNFIKIQLKEPQPRAIEPGTGTQ